ncbi:IclR family transcriptional regulator C-terminal domain-containing protein [Microbispora sp. GKU 823]|uniref:IclR family transcriptional regulator C-terminal domain-containing protein n=1 Tax=Microbispora sp. GKU 823 TaxID=1652100 RepID=UPI00277B4FDD|nr:IclR family transcriptional regulator C-terminal domain-containing protein [Microbispora sp. GKU 823]
MGRALPREARGAVRRDRQPRRAGGRLRRLRGPGALAAQAADVRRGRPPGAAAQHGRRQGPAGRAGRRGGGVPAHRAARRTDRTITAVGELLEELGRVRARGYALDLGEEESGVHCMAVPVHDGGRAFAAMSVSGPAERIDAIDREELAAMLRKVAEDFGAAVFHS